MEAVLQGIGPDAAAWPSPLRAWSAVAVFAAAAVVSYTDRQVLSLLVDPIRADLNVSDSQIGLVQGLAFVLIYGVAGLPLGRLADIAPRRIVLVLGILVWSASTVLCGLAGSFGALFLARIGVGVGEAALAPAALSMIGDLFAPGRRGGAIGVFIMGMVLGSGVAILAGGLVLQAATTGVFAGLPLIGSLAPWRVTLVLLGAPGPVLVAAVLTLAEPKRRDRLTSGRPASPTVVLAGFKSRAGVLVPLYLAMASLAAGDAAVGAWSPTLLSRVFHAKPAFIAAWIGGALVVTGLLGALSAGLLSDWASRYRGARGPTALAALAALVAVAGAGIGIAPNAGSAVAFLSVWALMSALAATIGIASVQKLASNEMRGLATSINALGNILVGIGSGTSLTAFLTDEVYRSPLKVGWSIGSVAGPAGLLAAGMFWLASRKAGRRPAVHDDA